jgi:tetratricopeptide (TPR) repeat protein
MTINSLTTWGAIAAAGQLFVHQLYSDTIMAVGDELCEEGNFIEARAMYQDVCLENIGMSNFVQASCLEKIGSVDVKLGEYQRALDIYDLAIEIINRVDQEDFGPEWQGLAGVTYNHRGHLAMTLGNLSGAEDDFEEALAIFSGIYPEKKAEATETVKNVISLHVIKGVVAYYSLCKTLFPKC